MNQEPSGRARQEDRLLIRALQDELNRTNQEVLALTLDLDARTAQLERANRELEAFAYSVSHDLRTPLRHLSGYLGFLAQALGPALEGEAAHCFERANAAGAEMARLIEALLGFSRLGRAPFTPGPVPLDPVLAGLVEGYRREQGERRVEWRLEPLPVVLGDADLLRTVFRNLLDNALKFTAPRAQALIQVGPGLAQAGEVVVCVRDNGVGFDPAQAGKLFGVFQRLHRQEEFPGTGIGLANVQRLMQRFGGRVWAEAEPGRGAAFFLAFPGWAGAPAPQV